MADEVCGLVEVKTNLAFSGYKRGQRLQVDIHDPAVRGLIQAGYFTIVWKEASDVTDPLDFERADAVSGDSVDVGVEGSPQQNGQADVDVTDSSGAFSGNSVRAPRRRPAREADE
jgi:hypothetical protein